MFTYNICEMTYPQCVYTCIYGLSVEVSQYMYYKIHLALNSLRPNDAFMRQ